MPQPLCWIRGDDAYENVLLNHWCHLWLWDSNVLSVGRTGWSVGMWGLAQGPGNILSWWPPGKASSHMWPPKGMLIARVPLCLTWKGSSKAAHASGCWRKDVYFSHPS